MLTMVGQLYDAGKMLFHSFGSVWHLSLAYILFTTLFFDQYLVPFLVKTLMVSKNMIWFSLGMYSVTIIACFVTMIFIIPIALVIRHACFHGGPIPYTKIGGAFIKRLPSFFLVILLVYILIAIALMIFVLPGVYLSVAFFFTPACFFFDGDMAITSILNSKALVRKRWWYMLGKLIFFAIVSFFIIQVLGSLTLVLGIPTSVRLILLYLLQLAFIPFLVSIYLVLFEQLKIAKVDRELEEAQEEQKLTPSKIVKFG